VVKELSQTKTAIQSRKSRKADPDRDRAYKKKWNEKNREKYLAQKVVENAVLADKLSAKPCEVCGSENLIHAHHDDYSKPMEVMWLCPTHHKQRHRELKLDPDKINLEVKPDKKEKNSWEFRKFPL
jgi:hypothetical protein